MFKRLWVQIPAPIDKTFFHFDSLLKLYCLFKMTDNKRLRGRGWPIFLKENVYFLKLVILPLLRKS